MYLDKYNGDITELDLYYKKDLNVIPDLSRFKKLEKIYLNGGVINNITSLQYLTNLKMVYLSIKLFIVKEIIPNSEIDIEIIKQVYQIYTEDEIKEYKNKVKEKFKDYNFIIWK